MDDVAIVAVVALIVLAVVVALLCGRPLRMRLRRDEITMGVNERSHKPETGGSRSRKASPRTKPKGKE